MIEHGHAAGTVKQPENSRIPKFILASGHVSMRIEAGPRSAFYGMFLICVCLKKKITRANASNAFQRVLRMLQMIENTIKEDEIESTESIWLQVIDIHQKSRRIGLPRRLYNVETAY